jgi:glyoxylase-like metal-dependent hydrolase (beta-lactamase superfamily II)
VIESSTGLFTTPAMQSYLAHEPAIDVQKLSARLWTATDGRIRAMFLEGRGSIIAFDTFGTPGRARAYRKAIANAIPGKPIGAVIYTHDHLDHAGCAVDLAPDAEIIADAMCAQVIGLRAARGQRLPTRVLSGAENTLNIDGVELTLLNPGPTHGSGHLTAYFAPERLLYSSDTILPNARYSFMPDYHIWNFVRFMRGFLPLDWDTFVPGRFEITDRARFEHGCDYIEALQEASQRAFAEFVPIWVLDAMTGYVAPRLAPRFGDLDGFEDHVGLTAFRIVHHYLMGGYSLEDTPTPGYVLADAV